MCKKEWGENMKCPKCRNDTLTPKEYPDGTIAFGYQCDDCKIDVFFDVDKNEKPITIIKKWKTGKGD
jgi:predicted nucleic-acid-binding Zn-ribbon protein